MDKSHIRPQGGSHPQREMARAVKMQSGAQPNQDRWLGIDTVFFISKVASIRSCTFLRRDKEGQDGRNACYSDISEK
jgi:hypothetical protein